MLLGLGMGLDQSTDNQGENGRMSWTQEVAVTADVSLCAK
jgi:hypothetical protein